MTPLDTLITLLVFTLLISVLFSVFNGLIINWKNSTAEKAERLSFAWHGVGLVMHVLLVALIAFIGGWLWAVMGFFLNWIGHNIIIAVIMGQKWYYVGKTAWFDKMIRKLLPFINFDK
jgi:hypothetical protein